MALTLSIFIDKFSFIDIGAHCRWIRRPVR
jgi:hypothetical protein